MYRCSLSIVQLCDDEEIGSDSVLRLNMAYKRCAEFLISIVMGDFYFCYQIARSFG